MPRVGSLTKYYIACALFAAPYSWAPAAPPSTPAAQLLALRSLDAQVLRVGDQLAVANVDLCADRVPIAGMAFHDLAQYAPDFRDAAQEAFGIGDAPSVLAADPVGAAARAGVRDDDVIVAADGQTLGGAALPPRASFGPIEQDMDRLDAAFADGSADLLVKRGGQQSIIHVTAPQGCRGRFQLVPGGKLNAGADGRYIQISSALTTYARSDDELAAILAHELAHNILHHRIRLDEAKVSRGIFEGIGRNARLIRETEVEADRLSVYLLDRAGYSIEAAADFWRRFGPRHELFASPTHGGWKSRVETIETEAAELARLKQSEPRPRPPMLKSAGAPLS